jgi:LysM repeat protein
VIRTSGARAWLGTRRSLARVVAAGGVAVLAGCSAASTDTGRSAHTENAAASAPATTAPAPTTTTAPPITYQVKRGDNLTAIARFFGVSSDAIVAANGLTSQDRITAGQVLKIPPAPPPRLVVNPSDGISGHKFTFALTGAKNGETVTFQIVGPDGGTFSGSPHPASKDGVVTTTYSSKGDDPGKYEVIATGDRGTSQRASYRLLG